MAAVAAAVQRPVDAVEAVCETLGAHGQFVTPTGLVCWPDGTVSGGYRFQHALYRAVLYEHVGEVRRLHLHAQLGHRLEAGYGARVAEIAAQLAVHFERGGDAERAVHYWQQAGENAAQRQAYADAIGAISHALTLLVTPPDTPERTRHEITLQCSLGELLMATKGVPAPEAAAAFTRAHELCQLVEETSLLPRVLWGLILFHTSQVQLRTAGALCQQLFHLAQREHDSDLLQEAHLALGRVELYRGHVVVARAHLEQSLPRGDTPPLCSPLFPGGYMLRVIHLTSFAHALWASGYTDQAQQRVQEALDLAHQEEHPPSLSWAEASAALVAQYRRDVAATRAQAEALMAFAAAQGFRSRLAQGRMLRGWALAMQGDGCRGPGADPTGMGGASVLSDPSASKPIFSRCSRRPLGRRGSPRSAWTSWRRLCGCCIRRRSAGGRLRCTDSRRSCYSSSRAPGSTRQKPGCTGLSTWPTASRPRRWSCAPH